MKIKKTIMGAALVAACFVAFPACSGGGGGGDGSIEESEGNTDLSGGADDWAPNSIVGKKMTYTNTDYNNAVSTYTFGANGKLSVAYSNPEWGGTKYWSGTYTYEKKRANNANLNMKYNSTTNVGSPLVTNAKIGLTFASPTVAYIFKQSYSVSPEGGSTDTSTSGGTATFH